MGFEGKRLQERVFVVTANVLVCTGVAYAQATTSLVSRSPSGDQGTDGSLGVVLTPDAKWIVMQSHCTHFVPADTNGRMDVFVRELATGYVTRESVSSAAVQGDGHSWYPRISPDGRWVVFDSFATNLVANDTNGVQDVFLRDRMATLTSRVSATNTGGQANGESGRAALSDDGRYVAFSSLASNLIVGDTNATWDVFVRDVALGTTQRISVSSAGAQGNQESRFPSLSADARYVGFWSAASNLVANDTNGFNDVFVRDRLLGTTVRASVWTDGTQANASSGIPSLSADGRSIAFDAEPTNWIAGVGGWQIWLRDLANGTTELVSQSSAGVPGNVGSNGKSVSADGRYVGFQSWADNLVGGDTNSTGDIYLRDRVLGITERISLSTTGVQPNNQNWSPSVSADGRYVAFDTDASNLVPNDQNGGFSDVMLRDRFGFTPQGANYCTAGTSSHGCVPLIYTSGTPSGSAGSGFVIGAIYLEGQRSGLVLYGVSGSAASVWQGGSSRICARPPLQRTAVMNTNGIQGACDGQIVLDWNEYVASHPSALGAPFTAGLVGWAQLWYRDPPAPGGSNLSAGVWFEVGP
ncbi:MAG: calcium-binding protein [Planctomycetes bacterium]|nr:calcium-binding protein [Planctomycetota bacterium]